jgi:hypothetical protein
MNAKMIRQGDVLLLPLADSPQLPVTGTKPVPVKPNHAGRLVLAQGETSLHEHTLAEDDAELVRIGEKMLLNLYGPTTLAVTDTHTGAVLPRHTPIELGGGLYEVRIQRELVQEAGRMVERRVWD